MVRRLDPDRHYNMNVLAHTSAIDSVGVTTI